MYCKHCGKTIPITSIFCPFCGTEIKKSNENSDTDKESHRIPIKIDGEVIVSVRQSSTLPKIDDNFVLNSESSNRCQICGQNRPTRKIHFIKNIGMFFRRQYSEIEGHLCKQCINRYFWEYFLTNILLGWWGTISFVINPFLILNNLWYFLSSIFMKKEFE